MTCQDRDQDILLYGLGELPLWSHLRTAAHLRLCARCRARQSEMARLSDRIAGALRPPPPPDGGTGAGPGRGASARPATPTTLLLYTMIVLTALMVTVGTLWFVHTRSVVQRPVADEPCRPGISSDLCR